jgi:hypothetical protein
VIIDWRQAHNHKFSKAIYVQEKQAESQIIVSETERPSNL